MPDRGHVALVGERHERFVPPTEPYSCNCTILDELDAIIVRLDATGRITYVNKAWTDLTGIPLHEMVGKDPMYHVHPDDRAAAASHLAEGLGGADSETAAIRFRGADGTERWMDVGGRVLRDDQGNPTGVIGTLYDITRRHAASLDAGTALDRAEQARERAERANNAKSEFLSRMSHELRTPLNAILGFAQLLELDELDGEAGDNVRHILRGGRHLLVLINDALDMTRIETGQMSMSVEPLPVKQVIVESISLVMGLANARGIRFLPLPEEMGEGCRVYADRIRLKQVLLNLLSNAVKYNRPHGTITVACRRLTTAEYPAITPAPEHGWSRITVSDTGLGIPTDRVDEAFAPFHRLGAETTGIEGIGLGLSVAKSLVEAMGGIIGIGSVPDVGTTLYVDLPAACHPSHAGIADSAESSQGADDNTAGTTQRTILYIEDNPENVALVRKILARRPNIGLTVAADGINGLELVRRIRPDVVLLDLHLPGLSGQEVLTGIRSDANPDVGSTPVVVITADLTPGTEKRLTTAGATAFLGKPLDVHQLRNLIDTLLSDS
jgi:PAS domain S-box-containing protein